MCPSHNGSVSAAEAAAAPTLLSPQQLNSLTHLVRRQLVAPRLLLLLLPPGLLLLLLLLCSSRCLPSKVVTAQSMLLLLLPLALMLSQGTPHQMLLLLLWPTVWTGWMQLLAGLVVAPGAAPHCTVWMAWGYWHVS
jgi:hypothetical protein